MRTGMFCSVEEILLEIKNFRPFLLADSADRENEFDLVIAAEAVTKVIINFMVTHCKGVICTPITKDLAKTLGLELLQRRDAKNSAYFTTPIEAKEGVTTGISAADRAYTIKLLTKDDVKPSDFITPGHVFPLIINQGGIKSRQGHTEGAATLVKLAGLKPIIVICELLNEEGDSAKDEFVKDFANKHNIKAIHIEEISSYLSKKKIDITF